VVPVEWGWRILGGWTNLSQATITRRIQSFVACLRTFRLNFTEQSARKYGLRILTLIVLENTLSGYSGACRAAAVLNSHAHFALCL
jgi:hypothetical protein